MAWPYRRRFLVSAMLRSPAGLGAGSGAGGATLSSPFGFVGRHVGDARDRVAHQHGARRLVVVAMKRL